jgi:hypothetical protein
MPRRRSQASQCAPTSLTDAVSRSRPSASHLTWAPSAGGGSQRAICASKVVSVYIAHLHSAIGGEFRGSAWHSGFPFRDGPAQCCT